MSNRISLRGMLRLIWVDTLRRVHNVGFLVGRLKIIPTDPHMSKTRVIDISGGCLVLYTIDNVYFTKLNSNRQCLSHRLLQTSWFFVYQYLRFTLIHLNDPFNPFPLALRRIYFRQLLKKTL